MPSELIEAGFRALAEDRSFSPRMREKFRTVLEKAALWEPWVVSNESIASIDGCRYCSDILGLDRISEPTGPMGGIEHHALGCHQANTHGSPGFTPMDTMGFSCFASAGNGETPRPSYTTTREEFLR